MHRVVVARSAEAGQATEEGQRFGTVTSIYGQIEMCCCKFGDDGEAPTTRDQEIMVSLVLSAGLVGRERDHS